MANDLTLPATGSVVRTIDNAGVHTQVFRSDAGQVLDAAAVLTAIASMIAGVRRDADTTPVSADGDVHPLVFDEAGRLKVAAQPGSQAATTGSITASAQNVSADVSRTSNITVYVTGTFAGHNCTFEGSIDSGTSWFAVQAIRTNANTIELVTGALSAAPAYAWELSVNGLTNFRVRATAHTSGTAVWRIQPAPYATEPIPGAQISGTQPVSGSLTTAGTTTNTPATPTPSNVNSAATTNATSVKTSAGTLYNIGASNTGAAAAFLKLYNKASAPTVGTDVPVLTLVIPASGNVDFDLGPMGHRFTTGIAFAITNLAADSDTTAIAASQVKVLTSYI